MPELPEVETVRRSLLPLVGRAVVAADVGAFTGVIGSTTPEAFAAMIVGRVLRDFRRRGKYLFIDFDDDAALLVHLRMTGQLVSTSSDHPSLRFEHLKLTLDESGSIRFADQRKFGRVIYLPPFTPDPLATKLGPEPLSPQFTARYLLEYTRGRTAPIKSLLLDQRAIAGLGNIYVDEALWLARIHPLTPAGQLDADDVSRLSRAVKRVIRSGIEHRGTSFSHFVDGDGVSGENQHHLSAYGRGRTGKPCLRCGTAMQWLTAGGRTSHYCPSCQLIPTPS